jgi:hypothetical protein
MVSDAGIISVDAESAQEEKSDATNAVYDYLRSLLPNGATVKELMAAKDLPKPTVQRYLRQLKERGSVRCDPKAGPHKADVYYAEPEPTYNYAKRTDTGTGDN